MRLPLLALISVLLALASGCGGDDGGAPEGADRGDGSANPVSVEDCLTGKGFGLQPSATGVSAVTPSGTSFTVAIFPTPEEAEEAAERAGEGATAIHSGVVTVAGEGRLSQGDLDALESCLG